MASHPTRAPQLGGSAKELVRAMPERNTVRRANVERRVATLRRIDEQLRAAGR